MAEQELMKAALHDLNEGIHRAAAALHETAAERHEASARFFDEHDND